jgi:branched-subunit amino acid ABC-type transport system permease component
MDLPIFVLLTQDGVTNGAVYALLALALVLVFAVTRVIFVPSGEFVAYGTLTLAGLQLGKPPPTIGLLIGMAAIAGAMEIVACIARGEARRIPRRVALWTGVPLALAAGLVVARNAGAPVLGADSRHARTRDAARSAALPDCLSAARRSERARAADRLGRGAFRADGTGACGSSAPRARARPHSRPPPSSCPA